MNRDTAALRHFDLPQYSFKGLAKRERESPRVFKMVRVEREFSPTLGDYRPPSQTRKRVDESSSRDQTNTGQTRENSRPL